MNPEDFAENIAEQIENYLNKKEQELRNEFRHPLSIIQEWNGYLIKLQGHAIRASHDASMHKWKFIMLKWNNGYYVEEHEFFIISEKKGQAILDFLNALAAATKKSSQDHGSQNDEIIEGAKP